MRIGNPSAWFTQKLLDIFLEVLAEVGALDDDLRNTIEVSYPCLYLCRTLFPKNPRRTIMEYVQNIWEYLRTHCRLSVCYYDSKNIKKSSEEHMENPWNCFFDESLYRVHMHIKCQLVYANAMSNTPPLHLVSRVARIILRQHHTLHWEWIRCSKFYWKVETPGCMSIMIGRKDPKPNLIIFWTAHMKGTSCPHSHSLFGVLRRETLWEVWNVATSKGVLSRLWIYWKLCKPKKDRIVFQPHIMSLRFHCELNDIGSSKKNTSTFL